MADSFLGFDDLLAAAADRTDDRPPALVANAHVTGLGVARALAAHDVPVIALDRSGDGVAPPSDAVSLAGRITYPLDDGAAFRADLAALAERLDGTPVAFGCMDEWVHGLAPGVDGVALSFAGDRIDDVLDKTALYGLAERLDVPYPETYRLAGVGPTTDGPGPTVLDPDAAAERLGFPLVLKPALKRRFEEAVGTNVIEAPDRAAYDRALEQARDAGVRLMAQERVPTVAGADRSFASYRGPDGVVTGMVGNARLRHPRAYGTSCVVDAVDAPEIRRHATRVLEATGYHGISEAEFVHDERRGPVLLDVNTRPWKWIGLPVAAGHDLPAAAYADATGIDLPREPPATASRWVSLRDYVADRVTEAGADGPLDEADWAALAAGRPSAADLLPAVYDPDDPGPLARLLRTEFSGADYYCSC